MGRHRQGAPDRRGTPAATTPEADQHRRTTRRSTRRTSAARTGLLGVSAVLALGAVAAASGLLPSSDYPLGEEDIPGARVGAGSLPVPESSVNDVSPASPGPGTPTATDSASGDRPPSSGAPASPSASGASRDTVSSPNGPATDSDTEPGAGDVGRTKGSSAPSDDSTGTVSETPLASRDPAGDDPHSATEQEVLTLVNQERAEVGCQPVTADPALADLAQDYSDDMAARGFFDHTDPDGAGPWDRAERAGIANLGGENIARGQPSAQAVMDAWMGSPGHRANILNCEYRTVGIGLHEADDGGSWWTQDFGF